MVDDWAVSGDGHHFWDYGVHLYHFKRLPRLLECDVCHQQARVPSDVSFICRNDIVGILFNAIPDNIYFGQNIRGMISGL